jgi:Zn-dependent peptidase ImmA (M78 family)
MINAFAAHFLMPRSAVQSTWNEFSSRPSRFAAIAVAVRFRVSWTAACNQLRNLGLIDGRERERLVEDDIRKGEMFELGNRPPDPAGRAGPGY